MENSAANNAVIYARFSSHSQTEQSIEGQLHVCHEYAEREGYTIVGEYIDRALTGRSDDRPDFQRMIEDAKRKSFKYVIVYKLDRFARNRYDSAVYKHKLKQCGVKVLSAMENIGDNPESIILEAVLEASAEYYSVDLSQKIKRGRRESALKGKYLGGGVPTGYKVQDGHLVVDEATAPVIQYFFSQYAAGVPKTQIVADLTAKGYRNKHGKPYGATAFQRALKSEVYIGVLMQDGIPTECPALIDKETFYKVQERVAQNAKQGKGNKAEVNYLLSGKLYCGMCGGKMLGVSGKGRHGDVHYYYVCSTRKRQRTCKKMHEKKDFIEWYVVEQTIEYVLTPARIEQIATAVVEQYERDFNTAKIRDLEHQLARIDADINKYVESLLEAPKAAHKFIYEKIEIASAQRDDISIDLSKLRIAAGIRYTKADIVSWLRQFCKGDLMDESFRERIIDTFINSVYLYDDKVVIFYNIKDGKQVSYIDMLESTECPVDFDAENNEGLYDERNAPAL